MPDTNTICDFLNKNKTGNSSKNNILSLHQESKPYHILPTLHTPTNILPQLVPTTVRDSKVFPLKSPTGLHPRVTYKPPYTTPTNLSSRLPTLRKFSKLEIQRMLPQSGPGQSGPTSKVHPVKGGFTKTRKNKTRKNKTRKNKTSKNKTRTRKNKL